jgi:hypothetical protein
MKFTFKTLAFLVLVCQSGHVFADISEIRWKYVIQFAAFTSWPEQKQKKLCSLGETTLPSSIDLSKNTKLKHAEYLSLGSAPDLQQLNSCQVIYFLDDISVNQVAYYLSQIAIEQTLTVSAMSGFNKLGGHIELVEVSGKLRFSINKEILKDVNFSMNPALISLSYQEEK